MLFCKLSSTHHSTESARKTAQAGEFKRRVSQNQTISKTDIIRACRPPSFVKVHFFFSREEMRVHVHVAHTDGEAKFWLEPKIELALNQGLPQKQINEAQALVHAHYEEIVHAWRIHFGN